MATPADMPGAKKTTNAPNAPTDDVREVDTEHAKEERPMIVSVRQGVNDKGEHVEIKHGPMPVEDWPAYEKEHNL